MQRWNKHVEELNESESLREEFINPSRLEETQRQLSNMICMMEEETCGQCILEKVLSKIILVMNSLLLALPSRDGANYEGSYGFWRFGRIVCDVGMVLVMTCRQSTIEALQSQGVQIPPISESTTSLPESSSAKPSSTQFPTISKPMVPPASAKVGLPKVSYYIPHPAKKRVFWTKEEEDRLAKGVHTYGEGRWADIRIRMKLRNRTNVELKVSFHTKINIIIYI